MDTNKALSPEEKARMGLPETGGEGQANTETVEGFFSGDRREAAESKITEAAAEAPNVPIAPQAPAVSAEQILAGTGRPAEAETDAIHALAEDHILGNRKVEDPAEAMQALIDGTELK